MDASSIKIIAETDDWALFDKPAGVSVHNQLGEDLISIAKERWPDHNRAFPINRLDKGTAGLVLFAKNPKAAKTLQQSFEKREVTKIYHARCLVKRQPPSLGDSGLWRWPLTNRAEGRKDPKGYWGKRIPCRTEWRVLRLCTEKPQVDLEINLLTGRKHQIRRHAAIQGWPLLGDPRYGDGDQDGVEPSQLIAKKLTFCCPEGGRQVSFESGFSLKS